MKRIIAVIPARFASSRFPGKPLADILGKPMIRRVYERVSETGAFSDVIVATDDERIKKEVERFGGHAVMTGECACGTERVYEASKDIEADIVVNIQGDEPLIKKEMILDLLRGFDDRQPGMVTLRKLIENDKEVENTNVVKVVTDINGDAVYFSRHAIPFNRGDKKIDYYKHIGIYGYTQDFLMRFVSLPETYLERAEKLEQLRAIENGMKIKVVDTKYDSLGVDTAEQLHEVERILSGIES